MSTDLVRRDARKDIEALREEFARALPKHVPSEKFVRTVITAIQLNPDLMAADRTTLLGACMRAAQDGLLPDGREAVLNVYNTRVKRKNEQGREVEQWVKAVQYLPMVRGLQKLARNSGEVKGLSAEIVYEKDQFEIILGDDRKLIHRPYLGEDPGEALFVYAVATLADGSKEFDWLTRARVEKARAVSKSPNGPLWTTWWDEAWKKTVIKRLTKKLPSSSDRESADAFMSAAERDDEMYDARAAKDVTPAAPAASLDDFADGGGGDHDPETGEVREEAQSTEAEPKTPVEPKSAVATPAAADEPALPLEAPAAAPAGFRIRFPDGGTSGPFATADLAVEELCRLAEGWPFEKVVAARKANDRLLNAAPDELVRRFVGIQIGSAPAQKKAR